MGQVINISEPALDLMLYGNNSSKLSNYIAAQMEQIRPTLFNEFSNRIMHSLQASYSFVNDKLTQYGLINQLSNQGLKVIDNYYEALMDFNALQNANMTMQRWVLSEPNLRQLYLDQNIDGYSESYTNVFGKDVGEQDYNYRRVMDGVIQDVGNGFVIKNYIEDLLPGDRELEHFEKMAILDTHDAIKHILNTCKFDFTVNSKDPVKRNK